MQIKKNTTILFLTFIIFLSFSLFIPQVYGADSNPHGYAVKYVTSFNGMVSGVPFQFVDKIVIDESAGEIYLLDAGNWRIVAVDTTGIYLYEFNYKNEGVERPITFDVDFKNGDMYLVEANKVTVLNYRGKFKRNFEIPHEEELNKFYINSIDVVETPKGTKIYMGDNANGKLFSVNTDGSDFTDLSTDKVYMQIYKSLVFFDDNFVILDSARYTVFRFDKKGKYLHSFGRLSGLLGGFSMPSSLAVDKHNRRIIVTDSNRHMVIIFDWNGLPLFEFGGPRIFRSPRAVAISDEGYTYVADATGNVKIFQVFEGSGSIDLVPTIVDDEPILEDSINDDSAEDDNPEPSLTDEEPNFTDDTDVSVPTEDEPASDDEQPSFVDESVTE